MLNLKEDISAKDIVNAIIMTNTPSNIVSEIKWQFKYNPFVFYRFPSMREILFKIEKYQHIYNAYSNRWYGIGFLHVREGYSSALYAVFLLEVEDAPFVKVRQVITYRAFAYINKIIFDYDELKKEKKHIPHIEAPQFYFGAKVDGKNLLKGWFHGRERNFRENQK